jgi:opacity protein-like surface antigen
MSVVASVVNCKSKGIMKRVACVTGLVAAVVGASSVRAADSGFFVFGGAGVNFLQDLDVPVGPPVGTVQFEFNPGSRLTAGVGYSVVANSSISLAVAGETGFLYNTIDQARVGAGTTSIEGDFFQIPFLAKAVLKFMPESRVSPFIGLGGGAVYSRLEIEEIGGNRVDDSGDETDPAVQGEAGIRYAISDEVGIGLSYKCLVAFPEDDVEELVNHSINFVFSFAF